MTSMVVKKSPAKTQSLIENSFVMTAKLSKVAFKNLIGDHKSYCGSLKNDEGAICSDSTKVIDLAEDFSQNKQYVIVGDVLSRFIENDTI